MRSKSNNSAKGKMSASPYAFTTTGARPFRSTSWVGSGCLCAVRPSPVRRSSGRSRVHVRVQCNLSPSSSSDDSSDASPNDSEDRREDSSSSTGDASSFSSFAAGPTSATKRRSLSRSTRTKSKAKASAKNKDSSGAAVDGKDESATDGKDGRPLRAVRALGNKRSSDADTDVVFEKKTAADFIAEGVVDDVDDVSSFATKDDIRFGIDDLKDPFKEDAQRQDDEEKKLLKEYVGQTVNVTGDAGVKKTLLTVGTGGKVPPGASVKVEYTGKLEDGTIFDSSRNRKGGFSFQLGKGMVIKGWEAAVATMRIGETAEFTITPTYAYGRRGMPPVIPGNSTLTFEIQVLDAKGGETEAQVQNVPDFNPDVPRTTDELAARYEVLKKEREEKRKTMTFFDKFYIISPFQSQTGEKPPWWINPNITFFIVAVFVAAGFYLVLLSGAIHIGYVDHPVDVNIFK